MFLVFGPQVPVIPHGYGSLGRAKLGFSARMGKRSTSGAVDMDTDTLASTACQKACVNWRVGNE